VNSVIAIKKNNRSNRTILFEARQFVLTGDQSRGDVRYCIPPYIEIAILRYDFPTVEVFGSILFSSMGIYWEFMSNIRIGLHNLILIFLVVLLSGCASLSSQSTATEPVADSSTGQPEGTPTPTLEHQIHSVTLLPGAADDEWRVVGLIHNQSDMQIEEIRLSIQLVDSQGQTLDETEVWAGMHFLDSDEESPFAAHFTSSGTPTGAEVELVSYEISEFVRPDIEVRVEDTIPIRTGGSSALGQVINSTFLPIYISAVPMVVYNTDGEIIDFSLETTFVSALGPRQITPLGAVFQNEIPFDVRIETYPDAIRDDRRGEASFEFTPPFSMVTSQGKLVALGEFQNTNWQQHQWLYAVLVAELDGETLALAQVAPPNPIAPGETRAYAIENLPGLHERLSRLHSGIEELSFDIIPDLARSGPVEGSVIPLTIHIDAYEAIGSSIFIRGTVANETNQDVHNAILMASLRSTQGQLRSAGWYQAAVELDAGAMVPFTMALDIPAGENVLMLEFDLIATGMNP
jgi:hypothetical protein